MAKNYLRKRPKYRIKHIYDLLEIVTGKSRIAIRKYMLRKGLQRTDIDFKVYLDNFYCKKFERRFSQKKTVKESSSIQEV